MAPFLLRVGIIALVIAVGRVSAACQFDTDCEPSSRCLKNTGSIYGVCAGGLSPGNAYDDVPVYDPLDPNETVGNTCQFDADCGPASHCLKSSGYVYGVCVRGSALIGRNLLSSPPGQQGSEPWFGCTTYTAPVQTSGGIISFETRSCTTAVSPTSLRLLYQLLKELQGLEEVRNDAGHVPSQSSDRDRRGESVDDDAQRCHEIADRMAERDHDWYSREIRKECPPLSLTEDTCWAIADRMEARGHESYAADIRKSCAKETR